MALGSTIAVWWRLGRGATGFGWAVRRSSVVTVGERLTSPRLRLGGVRLWIVTSIRIQSYCVLRYRAAVIGGPRCVMIDLTKR